MLETSSQDEQNSNKMLTKRCYSKPIYANLPISDVDRTTNKVKL